MNAQYPAYLILLDFRGQTTFLSSTSYDTLNYAILSILILFLRSYTQEFRSGHVPNIFSLLHEVSMNFPF